MPPTQILPTLSPNNGSQLLEEVYQGRQTYEFKRGITIPLHSQELWVVCRGILQLRTFDSEGNEAILGLAYPEMPFGLPFTQIDPYEVIALSDVVLMRITQIELERSSVLAQGILSQLNRRLQQAEDLLALVHLHPVSARCRELLLLLSKEIGEQTPEGIRIKVRLTHQQIADLAGVTRVTATRVLGELRKEGWLSIDRTRHLVVHSSRF
ncbi:Crp/Fnr family transcriptional regulator [Acaryochloris sp. CCMEE 5410]|uniref:Crp/Fnr family transcriptional regulator n=1 Tax=Acaryochloris sp. CCMEE 5410 TaxID=310037 RepID=UPI00024848D6|nr:Crp/Fnr family transcriptional regulator [Acaryochloris sp. CCMEE 5410]KAI9129837.1 Crp/Fnr family transcriptional regulator [Acaryochloris sp. CCMEE 5410]